MHINLFLLYIYLTIIFKIPIKLDYNVKENGFKKYYLHLVH